MIDQDKGGNMEIKVLEKKQVANVIAVIFENFTFQESDPFSGVVMIWDDELAINGSEIVAQAAFVRDDGSATEDVILNAEHGAYSIVIGFEGEVITKIGF